MRIRPFASILALNLLVSLTGGCTSAVEEVAYKVIKKEQHLELREYPPYIVAQTEVEGTLEDAGDKAFSRLFAYISGENRSQVKIAMTAPVTQNPSSEKIAMTAPVEQQSSGGGWTVAYVMPKAYSLASLPAPKDPEVALRPVPARRMASVQYSGTWSEKRYRRYLRELEAWIVKNGLQVAGEPVWARYNPPFTPWFLRRNEILIQVERK